MAHAANDGIIRFSFYFFPVGTYLYTIFHHCFPGVYIRVIDGDVGGKSPQVAVNVLHLGVSDVGTVLLEGEAENQDGSPVYHNAVPVHALYHTGCHISAHCVIYPAGFR